MAEQTTEQNGPEVVMLDTAAILTDKQNTRYGLKQTRLDSLKESILAVGEVLQPVEVEELETPEDGFQYRLTSGFYRHKAVEELNKDQNAGLLLPAIIRQPADETDRLRHQLAENMERENQSPMDKSLAIKELQRLGVSNLEIRNLFSAAGGRKGNQVQAMSNAMLNIHLRFLDLPKSIQEKIHDGRLGVAAAYELGKVPQDKRQAVLDAAEKERIQQIEREEKDEARYLETERKLAEAQAKTVEMEKSVETLRENVAKAEEMVKQRKAELAEAKKQPYLELPQEGPERKAVVEAIKASEQDVKSAEKLVKDQKNELSRMHKERDKAAELAEKKAEELAAARKIVKAAPKKVAPIGSDEVKKAAKATGASTGIVPLTVAEVRDVVKEMCLPSNPPIIVAIGERLRDCFNGNGTPKELVGQLVSILMPKKAAAPKAPAPAAGSKFPKAMAAADKADKEAADKAAAAEGPAAK